MRIVLSVILGLSLSAVCACSSQTSNPTQLVLNGPSDIAFACTGRLAGEATDRAFPPASCGPIAPSVEAMDAGVPDAGGGLPQGASVVALIPEKASGVLHVAKFVSGGADYVDQDPFSPGVNGLAVGRQPVSVSMTADGCWAVVSNSGSCDLAVVDVLRASFARPDPVVARSGVMGLPARTGEIARPPSLPASTSPSTCQSPSGKVFVAFPSCHLVARVDLATFQVVDGIRFREGAPPEIVGPDVTCPAECTDTGGAGTPDDDGGIPDDDAGPGGDAAQPVAMAIESKVAQHRITFGSALTPNHGSAATAPIPVRAGERLYLIYVQVVENDGAVPTSTVAGAGLTWTQAATVASTDARRRLTLFYATGVVDGTPVTITHSAATADATQWIVQDMLGVNLTAPIRQVITGTGKGSSASLTLQQPPAGDGSGMVAAFGVDVRDPDHPTNPAVRQLLSPGTAWTEVDEVTSLTNDAGTLEVQFVGGPLSAGAGWQRNSTYVAITAEVDLQSTLYIGAGDSPRLLVVDLDATGAPLAMRDVTLEGATGIRRLAASGPIPMGDETQAATDFNFVYAIADDQSIHVVDTTTGRAPAECDTQIDRRYLHHLSGSARFACFHLGDPQNPPRRPEAIGPGIRLPGGVLPIDVTFTQLFDPKVTPPTPEGMRGHFAVVAALGPTPDPLPRGVVYWIDIDDDDYPDSQQGISLADPDIVFGMPHAVRDVVPFRWQPSQTCVEENYPNNNGPYRNAAGFPLALHDLATNATGALGDEFAPNLHRVAAQKFVTTGAAGAKTDVCAGSKIIVYELSALSPSDLREELWTDASLVGLTETFTFTWEGPLGPDDFNSRKFGGQVKVVDGGHMQLDAPGANLCGLGPQVGDIARLIGCTGAGECAVDETCYIHPQAPSTAGGMCVPTDRVLEFSADCQSLLTTVRRYSVVDVGDDHAVLATRPRTMPESPIDGCADAPQCQAIQEKVLSAREDAAGQPRNTLTRRAFKCEADELIGGPKRCIEVCDEQNACEDGTTCERSPGQASGRCVLGPIPQPKCLAPLQRYELRAGEAFTVVSSAAGYRHREVVDPVTKACVVDPQKSSLLVARFGRNEPACEDTSLTGISPNPCTLPPADLTTGACPSVRGGFAEPITVGSDLCYRPTHAVRIRTPGLSFDVVDLSLPLELDESTTVRYSPILYGYAFEIQVAAGSLPFFETGVRANLPSRVRRGVNGEPWVVDIGDVVGGRQGQVILLGANPAIDAIDFRLF